LFSGFAGSSVKNWKHSKNHCPGMTHGLGLQQTNPHHQGGQPMYQAVTLDAIFVWFVWGFFMALGWVLGSWVMERLLGLVNARRV
jgi:hypothetical protein